MLVVACHGAGANPRQRRPSPPLMDQAAGLPEHGRIDVARAAG